MVAASYSYNPVLSILVGIIVMCISLYRIFKYRKYIPITATVISQTTKGYGKNARNYPTVQYTYEGVLYTNETERGGMMPFTAGKTAQCAINPDNPEQIILVTHKSIYWISVSLGFFVIANGILKLL